MQDLDTTRRQEYGHAALSERSVCCRRDSGKWAMVSRTNKRKVVAGFVAFLALELSLSVSVPVYAQVAGGTIQGRITDPSGAVVPNAQVSISNVTTNNTRTAATNSDGLYSAPNLLPGAYSVTVSAPGFANEVAKDITLTVGATQRVNLTMRVGAITEHIEVTGAAPVVE